MYLPIRLYHKFIVYIGVLYRIFIEAVLQVIVKQYRI